MILTVRKVSEEKNFKGFYVCNQKGSTLFPFQKSRSVRAAIGTFSILPSTSRMITFKIMPTANQKKFYFYRNISHTFCNMGTPPIENFL